MSAPSGSRRKTAAGSFSSCPDFVRELCAACLHANIANEGPSEGQGSLETVAMHMRRNIDLAARTSAPVRRAQNSVHHNIVIPASE